MTAIAGTVNGGTVWIGGDCAGVGGYQLTLRADEKVFINGDFLFGFTSSFRMGQLLRYKFDPPHYHTDEDLYAFMVTTFIDAVRNCLKEGGYASRVDEEETGGTFLVGFQGRLFRIDEDYQVGESRDGYDAVGCGSELSRGAFFATQTMTDQEARVRWALEAAEHHSGGVRSPFTILSIGKSQ